MLQSQSLDDAASDGHDRGARHDDEAAVDVELLLPVWKSTSVSGTLSEELSAMTWPRWLRRVVRNRHRHAIEQVSRRWRGGRRDGSARTRRKI